VFLFFVRGLANSNFVRQEEGWLDSQKARAQFVA
jgi:hypothetical protein